MNNKKFVEENYQLVKSLVGQNYKDISQEDREDLINDTVVRLLETTVVLDDGPPSGMLKKIIHNLFLNKERDSLTDAMGHVTESLDQPVNEESDERDMTLHDILPGTLDEDIEGEPDEKDHYSQVYKNDIEELCNHLPAGQAKLFRMRYYLGMTPTEIAEDTGLETRNVETTLHRAVKNAFKLTNTNREDRHRYNGLTIQEMALSSIQDDIDLFPFLMYYRGERSLLQIAKATNRSITSIKRSIKAGENILYNIYNFSMGNRA